MAELIPDAEEVATRLCLRCGLCCDGVMFGDVRVGREDHPERLLRAGLPLQRTGEVWHFDQPCTALECGACQVYEDRPSHCRQFECAILKETLRGHRTEEEAERAIDRARKLAQTVRDMLNERGDTNEGVALSRRYRDFVDRQHGGECAPEFRRQHGSLTVAVMSLNQVLKLSFYT